VRSVMRADQPFDCIVEQMARTETWMGTGCSWPASATTRSGVGTLKPVDETTAEVKRMYVRPAAQGLGVGRAILARLLQEARAERYATVRLETLRFMTIAQAMYRSFGFVEVAAFDGSEAANTVLEPLTIFMALDLAAGTQ
jgi:GNAT superfamily N-acetyltransferase